MENCNFAVCYFVKCDKASSWTQKWDPIEFYYNLHGHILDKVNSARYVGIIL
jgi:hypothetical protein